MERLHVGGFLFLNDQDEPAAKKTKKAPVKTSAAKGGKAKGQTGTRYVDAATTCMLDPNLARAPAQMRYAICHIR